MKFDAVVVGSGIAGLSFALKSSKLGHKVAIITKKERSDTNTNHAQGGIASVTSCADDFDSHVKDTLIAGDGLCNEAAVRAIVSAGPRQIKDLIEEGVEFTSLEDGSPSLGREGGHSQRRILHVKDYTGRAIEEALLKAVAADPNIEILEHHFAIDLITKAKAKTLLENQDDSIIGIYVYDTKNNVVKTMKTPVVMLATGGTGCVYLYTTNPEIATGDGIAMVYRAKGAVKDMEFIQFHPTAYNNKESRECFLISESVRGEGAYLLNCNKERFMHNYDERLELAPRDVVSRSIILESRKTNSDEFYLDIRYKGKEYLSNRFPMIYDFLMTQGIDMSKDLIPIFPCQHYLMGGINVNINAETSVNGLYAVGECSHTGVHGNNRLASNSLLEALVFGHRAAEDITRKFEKDDMPETCVFSEDPNAVPIPHGVRTEIRHIMQKSYFVIPDKQKALEGFERVSELKKMLETGNYIIDRDYVEAHSLATVAYLILKEVI